MEGLAIGSGRGVSTGKTGYTELLLSATISVGGKEMNVATPVPAARELMRGLYRMIHSHSLLQR
jgi:hypothetical protein